MNVSVGITSFNQRDYLIEAIESVLRQTSLPAEILIVDDASTDDSPQLISGYVSRYPGLIRPILLTINGGVNAARNHILDAATGEYLSFLDGDDLWRPNKLEAELNRLAAADRPVAVFSNFHFADSDGNPAFAWAGKNVPEGDLLHRVLTLDMPRATLFRSELVPTGLWRQAGYYDPSFVLYGDWDMRIRQARVVSRYAYLNESLSLYRRHGRGLSNKSIEIHLVAVDQIEAKYADLITRLEKEGFKPRDGLVRWRARLWRRAAFDIAVRRSPGFRAEAWRAYRRSLGYHRTVDTRLLWWMAKP